MIRDLILRALMAIYSPDASHSRDDVLADDVTTYARKRHAFTRYRNGSIYRYSAAMISRRRLSCAGRVMTRPRRHRLVGQLYAITAIHSKAMDAPVTQYKD